MKGGMKREREELIQGPVTTMFRFLCAFEGRLQKKKKKVILHVICVYNAGKRQSLSFLSLETQSGKFPLSPPDGGN